MTKIAIISDIHSNLEALNTVLKEIEDSGIKKIYCCGDIVGYGPEPNECVELINKKNIPSVMGNHDIACVSLQDKESFTEAAQTAIEWSSKILTKQNKAFLFNQPKNLEVDNIHFVHGSPLQYLWDRVFPDTSKKELNEFLNHVKKDILIIGHTHFPFVKRLKERLVINAGSVGQPRDGDCRASFAVLDTERKKADIFRLSYDINKTAEKIKKSGLPKFLAERLFKGE